MIRNSSRIGSRVRFLGLLSTILLSVSLSSLPLVPTAQATAPSGAFFDHLVVIMMENQGIANICGGNPPPCNGSNSPYMSGLANTYGISQQYLPLVETSSPNYYGFLGASIYNCTPTSPYSGCYPGAGSILAPNLVDRLEAANLSWKGFMENQSGAAGCDTSTVEPYEREHNPFVYFRDVTNNTSRCPKILLANPPNCGNVTDCTLINELNSSSAPNLMWLTPNDCDNMHAASVCTNGCVSGSNTVCIQEGDNYLKGLVPNILNSYTFQNTRAALFITFDEGKVTACPLNGNKSEDCLYSVWAGPEVNTNFNSTKLYNHYSLTKTIETNWNLTSLTTNDDHASPMVEFFPPASVGGRIVQTDKLAQLLWYAGILVLIPLLTVASWVILQRRIRRGKRLLPMHAGPSLRN